MVINMLRFLACRPRVNSSCYHYSRIQALFKHRMSGVHCLMKLHGIMGVRGLGGSIVSKGECLTATLKMKETVKMSTGSQRSKILNMILY